MIAAVVGLGHIGGSFAAALARTAPDVTVIGHDADPAAAERARALGLCARVVTIEEAAGAEVVAIAVPVRSIGAVARALAAAGAKGVVTDVGSTKVGVVREGEAALGGRFVGGHPLAGTERAGPEAADPSLFEGRRVILTPTAATDPEARERIAALWRQVGATVTEMDAERHDRVMAAVSHLPHVAAYALAGAIGALGEGGGRAFTGLTGGGFLDTTRIASTPPRMWIDVMLENRDALLACIDELQEWVASLRRAILERDAAEIERILVEARAARQRVLGGE